MADEHYHLLGVGRDTSRESLKRAFRSRLFDAHPDRNPNDLLACERTRQIVEAYRTLSSPNTCESLCPIEQRVSRRASATPVITAWGTKALAVVAMLALMVFFTTGFIREVFGDPSMVFRPDPSALTESVEVKALPLLIAPDIADCVTWYHAQEYQLTLAGDWATREMVRACHDARRRAQSQKDKSGVAFYGSLIHRASHTQQPAFL